MKYVLIIIAVTVLTFGIGYLVARLIFKKAKGTHLKLKKVCVSILIGLLLMGGVSLIYFNDYYRGDDNAKIALLGNDEVLVKKIDGGYLFDGPKSSKVIVFYPGAKVECEAYAPLMLKLAERGYDCFLADMPLNFPILKGNAAKSFIDSYNYDTWIMAGHSMGGLMASKFACDNQNIINGIILLGSYPIEKIDNNLALCSIYGSEDGCLQHNVYKDAKEYWPNNSLEYIIEGGNHAQFGNYGAQASDGKALISADVQQVITVDIIQEFFK